MERRSWRVALAVSDLPKVPRTLVDGSARQVEIPGVEVAGVNVSVAPHPVDPSKKALFIGPLMLVLPFDLEMARVLATGLTGIEIVVAGGGPPLPPRHLL